MSSLFNALRIDLEDMSSLQLNGQLILDLSLL